MTSQAAPHDDPTAEEQLKRLRSRKIYIQLRVPRARAEVTAITARKTTLVESGGEASKEVLEERIYCNQHLLALRKELESLEQERKTVLQSLREVKMQQTGTPLRTEP
jgi:hypothetical protein